MKSVVQEDHMMFRFESSMTLGVGDKLYLEQLCLQVGFQCENGFEVILSGEDTLILDVYPEIGFFR
jgi:hypothetical protein